MSKAYRSCLLLLLLGWPLTLVRAQEAPPRVQGRAVDGTTGEPLIGATVQLVLMADTTVRTGGATDPDGRFNVLAPRAGAVRLSVSFLGFRTSRQLLTLAPGETRDLGTLPVRAAAVQLNAATVTGRTPPAVQRGDTTQLNANAFKTNPDASSQDLITKMPGITVGADGKVQAQGEAVQKVLVDGKQFFGDDPDAVLKNLPAEAVDKVEIFDRRSEQSQFSGFDDGNTQKTINIVTKPQYRTGQFGRVVAGAGTPDGRYRASVALNSFDGDRRVSVLAQSNNVNEQNFGTDDLLGVVSASAQPGGGSTNGRGGGRGGPGGGGGGPGGGNSSAGNFLVNQRGGINTTHVAGINYTDKLGANTNLTASYFFNYADNVARTTLARQFVLPSLTGTDSPAPRYDETATRLSQNQNHRVALRLEHKFDSANTLLWTPRASVQINQSTNDLLGQTRTAADLGSTVRSRYTADLTGLNLGGELLYSHRFGGKRGRTLSLSATPTLTRRTGPTTLRSGTGLAVGEPARDSLDQRADLTQTGWGLASNLAYTEPVGAHGQVQGTYAFSVAPNESDKKTFNREPLTDQYTRLDTTLSSVFTNRYTTHGAGLSYRYNDRKMQASAGVTGQRAQLAGDQTFPAPADLNRTFYSLLPSAQARVRLTANRNLRLNYQTSANAPSITQLQQVVNNSNPLQLTTGNPNLRQDYQHRLFARYSAANPERATSFFALLAGSVTQYFITNETVVAVDSLRISPTLVLPPGAQLTRPVNLSGYYAVRSLASYGLPLKALKSTLNLNASAVYTRTPGLVNGGLNYASSPVLGGGVTLASNISEKLDFTLTSNTAFTSVTNTLRKTADNQYVNQSTGLRLSWIVGPGISVQTDVSHQLFSGLTAGFNQNYVLWNASIGKKILPGQRGELKLYCFDILKQNQSIQRTITEAYVEDQRATILQRYLMVMFTYNIRRGSGAPAATPDNGTDGERRGFPGGQRPPGFGPPPGQ